MNACTHYGKPSCVYPNMRASVGACWRCASYVDSGQLRTAVTVRGMRPKPQPIPRDQWGEGMAEWTAQRIDSDKGVGSTLCRIGTPEAKAILIQLTIATGCKCRERVAICDVMYPYA